MACRWRIRHKLMLGLGLVIAIIALLLLGTFKGLWSYRDTTRTVGSKLNELKKAHKFRDQVRRLANPKERQNHGKQLDELMASLQKSRNALGVYETTLKETVRQGRSVGNGRKAQDYVDVIGGRLDALDHHFKSIVLAPQVGTHNRPMPVSQLKTKAILERLLLDADHLSTVIHDGLQDRLETARKDYVLSRGFVLFVSIAGLILVASLLRGFVRRLSQPIRELVRGAERVAQGNFEEHVRIQSQDELHQFADAFNHMMDKVSGYVNELEKQVNERSRQLVRSERLASVGYLAAGVAHEINNPLASIAFCSEALEQRLHEMFSHVTDMLLPPGLASSLPQNQETVQKYLKMIQDEAFRCKTITQKLLDFSRGGDRNREPADLVDIIQSVIDISQLLEIAREKQIVFDPTRSLLAWVNAQEIKSVVLNLVMNALENMDEGGILTITHGQRDGMSEVVFQDTGCGMSPEVLENIFEPFFTRSRTGKGTGLGLSITHRIINQHDGEIEASSLGVGHGSTFVMRLPVNPSGEQRSSADRDLVIGNALQQTPILERKAA
ncbi:MAG: ATP-binding protein [Gemmataceae bacterium]